MDLQYALLRLEHGIFNIKEYGAVCDNSTDDSAAILATIAAVKAAGGGTVYFPKGGCVVANDPKAHVLNGKNVNCQLCIPTTDYNGNKIRITFEFESSGSFEQQGISSFTTSQDAAFIRSTYVNTSATTPTSVIGFEASNFTSGLFEVWNYSVTHFINAAVITTTLSGTTPIRNYHSGINLLYVTQVAFRGWTRVMTTGTLVDSVNPFDGSSEGSYGIIFPKSDNHAMITGENFYVCGYFCGIQTGEHLTISGHYVSLSNRIGLKVREFYPVFVSSYCSENTNYHFNIFPDANCVIGKFECENNGTGKWYDWIADVITGDDAQSATASLTILSSDRRGPLSDTNSWKITNQNLKLTVVNDQKRNTFSRPTKWTTSTRPASGYRVVDMVGLNMDNPAAPFWEMWNGTAWVTIN